MSKPSHAERLGLIIAYMQARLPARRARGPLARQRRKIEQFQLCYSLPIDMWYSRAKGLSPLPTPEQLIEAGEVYALIVSSWDKLRGCGGYWPEIWQLCNIIVRKAELYRTCHFKGTPMK